MKLGLKNKMVELYDHQSEWKENAEETINLLKNLFGVLIIDIQHIGSTAINGIKAKPIIDIVIGIDNFEDVIKFLTSNEGKEFISIDFSSMAFIINNPNKTEPKFMIYYLGNKKSEIITHHIHFVEYNGDEWNNYVNFRDYMNNNEKEAKNYEKLKIKLMKENRGNRENYTKNKDKYITKILNEAKEWRERTISR